MLAALTSMPGSSAALGTVSAIAEMKNLRRRSYLSILQRIKDAANDPDFPSDPLAGYQKLIPLHFSDDLPTITGHTDPYTTTDPARYVIYRCRAHGLMPERMNHYGVTPDVTACPICGSKRHRDGYTTNIPEHSTIYREWVRPSVEYLLSLLAKEEPRFTDYYQGMLASRDLIQPLGLNSPPTFTNPGRNQPCPCGSGKKAKRCHFP
jgi:hypothetical protein